MLSPFLVETIQCDFFNIWYNLIFKDVAKVNLKKGYYFNYITFILDVDFVDIVKKYYFNMFALWQTNFILSIKIKGTIFAFQF